MTQRNGLQPEGTPAKATQPFYRANTAISWSADCITSLETNKISSCAFMSFHDSELLRDSLKNLTAFNSCGKSDQLIVKIFEFLFLTRSSASRF